MSPFMLTTCFSVTPLRDLLYNKKREMFHVKHLSFLINVSVQDYYELQIQQPVFGQ